MTGPSLMIVLFILSFLRIMGHSRHMPTPTFGKSNKQSKYMKYPRAGLPLQVWSNPAPNCGLYFLNPFSLPHTCTLFSKRNVTCISFGENCTAVDLASYINALCQGQWPRGTRDNGHIKHNFLLEKSVETTSTMSTRSGIALDTMPLKNDLFNVQLKLPE